MPGTFFIFNMFKYTCLIHLKKNRFINYFSFTWDHHRVTAKLGPVHSTSKITFHLVLYTIYKQPLNKMIFGKYELFCIRLQLFTFPILTLYYKLMLRIGLALEQMDIHSKWKRGLAPKKAMIDTHNNFHTGLSIYPLLH